MPDTVWFWLFEILLVEHRSVFARTERMEEKIDYKGAKGTHVGEGTVLIDSMIVVVVTWLHIFVKMNQNLDLIWILLYLS